MKLMTTDGSELMHVTKITAQGRNLIITGTIMGAMPVQAVLNGKEMRSIFRVLPFGTALRALVIFLFR